MKPSYICIALAIFISFGCANRKGTDCSELQNKIAAAETRVDLALKKAKAAESKAESLTEENKKQSAECAKRQEEINQKLSQLTSVVGQVGNLIDSVREKPSETVNP